jgi:hypothetical protein
VYVGLEFFLRSSDKIVRPAVLSEQLGGDDVHTFVRALGRKYGRDKKLERVRMLQCAMSAGICLSEALDYFCSSVDQFGSHRAKAKKESGKMQIVPSLYKIVSLP